ncbi:hypothetical protein BKM31_50240 [[Actinomadura] parvosata subsp. kistnae]|uniref:Uncharacterized protein n=1 Tax=[Actinomadura] parvosata subsp. kistnae TaxID=1909395 RepID=A0A1V0AEF0_9ACTN|nr:hypothetical protein BKM31_50240 [Nonomuraea sp. ATCC 55076]
MSLFQCYLDVRRLRPGCEDSSLALDEVLSQPFRELANHRIGAKMKVNYYDAPIDKLSVNFSAIVDLRRWSMEGFEWLQFCET